MPCHACERDEELRRGFCFDCCNIAERLACKRSTWRHLVSFIGHVLRRKWENAQIDIRWAWGRLTNTGDYRPGGYFDKEHPGWR